MGLTLQALVPWRSVSEGSSKPGGPVTGAAVGEQHRPVSRRSQRRHLYGLGGPQLRSRPWELCRLWALEKRVGRQQQARRTSYWSAVGNNIALFLADPNGGSLAWETPTTQQTMGTLQALGLGEACRKAAARRADQLLQCRGGTTSPCFSPIATAASITALGDPNYEADHGSFAGFGAWRSVSEGSSTPGARVTAVG